MTIDATDRKILAALQSDAALSLADLGKQVGLSTTPCWRRIQRLEQEGYIRKRVVLLDRARLNVDVTVFVAVRTSNHSAEWLEKFRNVVAGIPEVVDLYRLSGEIDYLLRVVIPDIKAYDAFYRKLIERIELQDVSSMFAMEEMKSTTEIPLSYAVSS
ncbi:transcriptional regulator, AsnC/Lrp family (plasmid) [Azospirillum lipoferum 4B]|uniref:Transcriptional regulator, AsnC/Lrp family n=1 Tax=Azospirillum lipoferum (strain 4B) TaxID=862719 RepID=G7ZGL1_AZOL4|nr:transcriptional regulator, AsnC/Lrp family [Azospirillum lipoferum 4B]